MKYRATMSMTVLIDSDKDEGEVALEWDGLMESIEGFLTADSFEVTRANSVTLAENPDQLHLDV